jgi:hypothetical protein
MPDGYQNPVEAKLGESALFLNAAHREMLTDWWLAVRRNANTPNWDIVSQATIDGEEGLILVEAKAHSREWGTGTCGATNQENRQRIALAIEEANAGLNGVMSGWGLSCESHYQLANRFAWSWKIATLGVPVVLVYLGFVQAQEMSNRGKPLADAADWKELVLDYADGVVPSKAWGIEMAVPSSKGITPLRAVIHAV